MSWEPERSDTRVAAREALVFWTIGGLVVITFLVVHGASVVLLLTFGGVLFGTALRGAAELVSRHARLSVRWSLVLCVAVLALLAMGAGSWIVPRTAEQIPALWNGLLEGWHDVRRALAGSTTGQQLLAETDRAGTWLKDHFSIAVGVVTGFTGAIGAIAYTAFVAVYFAAAPEPYRRGVIALVPPSYRPRAREILGVLGTVLERWVWARVCSMTILGIATTIGLWLLGIPLAFTLGLLAGTLLFIPYLGAIASAIPALLMAASLDAAHVLYVVVLYLAIHAVDGYVLDPQLQKHAVRAPPLLVLGSQLVFGAIWGILGFMYATPLMGALVVATRMFYVEDVLQRGPSEIEDGAR
jgi:predicted PurR-regulated permease PerM